jgi:hypothetical protein
VEFVKMTPSWDISKSMSGSWFMVAYFEIKMKMPSANSNLIASYIWHYVYSTVIWPCSNLVVVSSYSNGIVLVSSNRALQCRLALRNDAVKRTQTTVSKLLDPCRMTGLCKRSYIDYCSQMGKMTIT